MLKWSFEWVFEKVINIAIAGRSTANMSFEQWLSMAGLKMVLECASQFELLQLVVSSRDFPPQSKLPKRLTGKKMTTWPFVSDTPALFPIEFQMGNFRNERKKSPIMQTIAKCRYLQLFSKGTFASDVKPTMSLFSLAHQSIICIYKLVNFSASGLKFS